MNTYNEYLIECKEYAERTKNEIFNVEDHIGKLPPDIRKYYKVPGLHKALIDNAEKMGLNNERH